MTSIWRLQPAGYAIRDVERNAVDLFAGVERLVAVREPGGDVAMIARYDGRLFCSCGAWGCAHVAVVEHWTEPGAASADAPSPPEAA